MPAQRRKITVAEGDFLETLAGISGAVDSPWHSRGDHRLKKGFNGAMARRIAKDLVARAAELLVLADKVEKDPTYEENP